MVEYDTLNQEFWIEYDTPQFGCNYATPKYSFLTWLATKNRLTTGDRMLNWQVGANPSCVFCNKQIEDRDHLFFECCYALEIWSGLCGKILGQNFTTRWNDVQSTLTDMSMGRVNLFLTRYAFQIAV